MYAVTATAGSWRGRAIARAIRGRQQPIRRSLSRGRLLYKGRAIALPVVTLEETGGSGGGPGRPPAGNLTEDDRTAVTGRYWPPRSATLLVQPAALLSHGAVNPVYPPAHVTETDPYFSQLAA